MVKYSLLAMAGVAIALPLNINLGAYSPALVVGDGEISFGGNQDVSNLMNALEGAAVNAAQGAAPARAEGAAVVAPPAAQGAAALPATQAAADPGLNQQAQQISALQGMGKEIAPREEESAPVAKRDIAGFDRALRYAEVALQAGPKVQLGTGKEGSGVGIIVDNNQVAAARAGTGAAAEGARAEGVVAPAPAVPAAPAGGAEKKKRDVEESAPKAVRAKVTTMYVRSGIPASLQSSSNVARDVSAVAPQAVAAPVSRRDAIDAVNLNVDGNQGVTLTFVETVTDDEE